ncbi:adenylate/guanylate cyclase domain-containing protein [Winogradskyella vincentii]|uniref:Guanylate cyclase domain-containing protein n=1 Tax=Winogradskyella vincentii TaxID=2877122 RepID=A0ABS7XZP9_9FLAO|nr:adenylate/guanylate cyclase domain-containing protein [Winogradskyella vincentii]MCA0153124.1 hypothetical protein [Winogradskyella vincentii]
MSETHKLSTILFADITGYTSLMQSDERKAMQFLNSFKTELEKTVPVFYGEIVQYFGDACLLTFDSTSKGVACAKTLQENFQKSGLPIRIGMHLGEVIFTEDNVFGDGVNIASRIESMGVPGTVLVSSTVRNQIKNKSEFQLKSLGHFEYKNLEDPIEVYALTNEGLIVPDVNELHGKFKYPQDLEKITFLQKIWSKKVPQILVAYLLLSWTGLQILDWALIRFGISPQWAKIFFIIVTGIIPSILVYLNNKKQILHWNNKIPEKIFFPLNFVLIGLVLVLMFRTEDLGAISKNITYINTDGEVKTQGIIKSEFKKQFPVFAFDPIDKTDSTDYWIGLQASMNISYLLNQDKYLTAAEYVPGIKRAQEGTFFTTVEKTELSKPFKSDFYIDGQYQYKDGQYIMIPAVKNKVNGNVIKEKEFASADLFTVTDSIVAFLRGAVGLTPSQMDESLVLDFDEVVQSRNIDAIKEFTIGYYTYNFVQMDKAIQMDTTWVAPAKFLVEFINYYSLGEIESKILINRIMRHSNNLPFQEQIGIRVQKHLIYKEWKKAEQLLNLQLEIEPNNEDYNFSLSNLYLITGQIDKYIEQALTYYNNNPDLATLRSAVDAFLLKGEPESVITIVEPFLKKDPTNVVALEHLAEAYLHLKEYDLAEETINKILIINPEFEPTMSPSLEAINYMKSNGKPKNDLSKFTGHFRLDHSELILELSVLGDNLQSRGKYQEGLFLFPSRTNTFQRGKIGKGHRFHFLVDEQNNIYAQKRSEYFVRNNNRSGYDWKQDSIIWKAESLLKKGQYNGAYEAYNTAITAHPKHYYLKNHLEHLQYLKRHTEEAVQSKLQRFVGNYREARIWIEDGLLYYKENGNVRQILRPISNNRFITLSRYNFIYEFIEENNKIVAVRSLLHDFEKDEWQLNRDWYYKRTVFKD